MARRISGTFENPDHVETIADVHTETIEIGDMTIGRIFTPPGWKWSTHIRQIVGTEWCEHRHMGFVLSGEMTVSLADGTIHELVAGSVYNMPPEHDAWVVGNNPFISIEWKGLSEWFQPRHGERVLATLLFTDIVDSTIQATSLGDRAWRVLLTKHDETIRQVLAETRGLEVNTTGDGFLARFEGPAQALDAAKQIREHVGRLELELRQGLHVGEVELLGGALAGLAVHEAARIVAEAQPGEILVSAIARSLSAGGGFMFESRGNRRLKGIKGARELFALIA